MAAIIWNISPVRRENSARSASEPWLRFPPRWGVSDQLTVGLVGNLELAHHVQAALDELFGGEGVALAHQAVNHCPDAGEFGLAQVVGGEVNALHQGAAVNPLVAGVPTLDSGGVHQVHTHVLGFLGDVEQAGLDFPVVSGQAQGAGHHFGGVLDLGVAGVLEGLGIEQDFEHGLDVVAGLVVGLLQFFNEADVLGRGLPPGGDGHLVADEEVVEVSGDEPGGGRVLANQAKDVVAVPVPGLAQEGLFRIVVVGRVEAELPGTAAVREGRISGSDVPAGEGAGAGLDVVFGIVEVFVPADTHGEKLQEFPSVVLVDGDLVAFRVVQVVNHSGVGGQEHEHVPEVAHAVFPEHLDHEAHFLAAVNLAVAGAENHVPEQGHLLLQLPWIVNHVVNPLLHVGLNGRGFVVGRLIAHQQVFLDAWAGLRVQQLCNGSLVPAGGSGLDFLSASSEARATQQVRHQGNVLFSHGLLLSVFLFAF